MSSALRDFFAVLIDYYEVLSSHDDPETTQLFLNRASCEPRRSNGSGAEAIPQR